MRKPRALMGDRFGPIADMAEDFAGKRHNKPTSMLLIGRPLIADRRDALHCSSETFDCSDETNMLTFASTGVKACWKWGARDAGQGTSYCRSVERSGAQRGPVRDIGGRRLFSEMIGSVSI